MVAPLSYLKEQIDELDESVSKDEKEIETILWNMPNVLDKAVPYGESEEQNKVIKTWGTDGQAQEEQQPRGHTDKARPS